MECASGAARDMRTLPENLILEKNKTATQSAWLVLLDITLNDEAETKFHLVRNTISISYKGTAYEAFPFELAPTVLDNKGAIPYVELKISNVTRLLQPYLLQLSGAVGASVLVTVVNSEHLDTITPDLEMEFVITATQTTKEYVIFRLGASNPLQQRFPLHTYLGLHCRWQFRSVECGYSGAAISWVLAGTGAQIGSTWVESLNAASKYAVGTALSLTNLTKFTAVSGKVGVVSAHFLDDWVLLEDISLEGSTDVWESGVDSGDVGYADCNRTLLHCRRCENSPRFGGFAGMRAKGMRLV